jgi:hypothetical protein
MYYDASQYTAGVASPLWPQDISQHQWYQQGTMDNQWHGHQWHGHQMSYGRQNEMNFSDDYRDYGDYSTNYQGTYHQGQLDNRLASQASQLGGLAEEPEEVLVVNSISSGAYSSLCVDAAAADLVAFDTEWAPDRAYGSDNPISVLQLAFPISRRTYVVQLNRIGDRLPAEVQMMLVNPEVRKVGFAVDINDKAKMARSGIALTTGSVTDVQELCATALGVDHQRSKSLSLKHAAFGLLGTNLDKDKSLSCSDWSAKELTQRQVRYAALDAWVPLRLVFTCCYQMA